MLPKSTDVYDPGLEKTAFTELTPGSTRTSDEMVVTIVGLLSQVLANDLVDLKIRVICPACPLPGPARGPGRPMLGLLTNPVLPLLSMLDLLVMHEILQYELD